MQPIESHSPWSLSPWVAGGAAVTITLIAGRILGKSWGRGFLLGALSGIGAALLSSRQASIPVGHSLTEEPRSPAEPIERHAVWSDDALVLTTLDGATWRVDSHLHFTRTSGINQEEGALEEGQLVELLDLVEGNAGPLLIYQLQESIFVFDLDSGAVLKTFEELTFDPETDVITASGILQVVDGVVNAWLFYEEDRLDCFEPSTERASLLKARALPNISASKLIVWDDAGGIILVNRNDLLPLREAATTLPLDESSQFLELPETQGRYLLVAVGGAEPSAFYICDLLAWKGAPVGHAIIPLSQPLPITQLELIEGDRVRISNQEESRELTHWELYDLATA